MDILPGHDTMDLWGSSRPAASTPPGDGGTQAHVLAVIEHATGRTLDRALIWNQAYLRGS